MSDDLKSMFQVSEVEITYKNRTPYQQRLKVNRPEYAYDIFKNSWDQGKIELLEQFKIMLLDHGSNCLGISEISRGGIDSCLVDLRLLYTTALLGKATGLILGHNHPGGVLRPSEADILLTKRVVEAGKLLGITVMDHLIITPHGYYSFADNDVMPDGNPKSNPAGQFLIP